MGEHAMRHRWGALEVRSWPLWSLPPRAVALVLVVVVGTVAAVPTTAVVTGIGGWRDLLTFAVLSSCGLVSVEVVHRIGEPSGLFRDLMTVWTLPVALLLPPMYALLAGAPATVLAQLRVRPAPVYRRVFSAASIGVAHAGAGRLFRWATGSRLTAAGWVHHTARLLPEALGAGVVCAAINLVLVAVAVRLSTPEARWIELLWNPDNRQLDCMEIATGVLVTALATLSLWLIPVVLVPMIMLHRSLLYAQLRAAARTDPKTGLLNASTWNAETEREIARAVRARRPLAVMIVDLDRFKAVNDAHGHLVGDQVLAAVADLLRSELREVDVLGRFGGEEFVAALSADAALARSIAERLRRRIAEHVIDASGVPVRVTASIGIATLGQDGTDPTELLTAADAALYAAKTAGRNRVADDSGA